MSLTLLVLLSCVSGCDPAGNILEVQRQGSDPAYSMTVGSALSFEEGRLGTAETEKQRRARPPALPQVFLDFPYPAMNGRQILVRRGDDLQGALNKARRGDEVVLEAGATFTGNFTLPAKPGSVADGWIVVRSDQSGRLPDVGNRVAPEHAILMAKVETPNQRAAIETAPGTSGWRLVGFEVTASPSVTALNYGIVALGNVGPTQRTLDSVPTDLVLDRMYIHGLLMTNSLRCVALNSARTAITDSYIAECHAKGYDSQAILGWNGPGPYKIVNNMLAGAGENVMFGGGDPSIPDLVPSDIEIRRNHIYKPISWKGVWTVKNLLETKNAARVLVEANVLEGSWVDAQGGAAILLRSTNQGGGCRWCRTVDVTIRRNLIRNSGAGIGFVGGDVNPADTTARRILVTENVMDGLNTPPYTGANARAFMLTDVAQITIERTVASGTLYQGLWTDRSKPSPGVVLRDVVLPRGQHGIGADGLAEGSPGLNAGSPGLVWSNVTIIGPPRTTYPPGTRFAANESAVPLAASIRATVTAATAGVANP